MFNTAYEAITKCLEDYLKEKEKGWWWDWSQQVKQFQTDILPGILARQDTSELIRVTQTFSASLVSVFNKNTGWRGSSLKINLDECLNTIRREQATQEPAPLVSIDLSGITPVSPIPIPSSGDRKVLTPVSPASPPPSLNNEVPVTLESPPSSPVANMTALRSLPPSPLLVQAPNPMRQILASSSKDREESLQEVSLEAQKNEEFERIQARRNQEKNQVRAAILEESDNGLRKRRVPSPKGVRI